MTVNLATVTGTLETLTGAAPSLGRMWFRLNRPDWTLTGEIFAPEYIEAIADGSGAFSKALQSTDDFEAGATYSAILKYREPLDGKDREYVLGAFALPTGGPYELGDLLAVPIIAPVPADILALCQAYAVAADADRVLAQTAAAEAVLYGGIQVSTMDDLYALTAGQVAVGVYVVVKSLGAWLKRVASGGNLAHTASVLAWDVLTPSALAFGAVGDGVTNDTLKFSAIEASTLGPDIDLGGKTYALTSAWSGGSPSVLLTKNYKNGTLKLDGRKLVFDRAAGLASAGAFFQPSPSTNGRLGLTKRTDHDYSVWQPLGGRYWAEYQIARSGGGVPFNWQQTWLRQILGIIGARDVGTHTYTGGWATDTGSTALTASDAITYIGGRAQQSLTVGDYVDISYTGGGDLFVIFTGRTSGKYINVLLNSAQKYLILPDDAGSKYFDSYTAVDLSHRQIVQIASGVPNGTHTIRLTVSASQNPAWVTGGGSRYVHNALAFSSQEVGPWTPETDAKEWATGQVILNRQVRKWLGRYYYATADGTTGATAPTHTTGTVSDGGVSWTYRADSGYVLPSHRLQGAGSQAEYAYEIKPSGATTKEDVGGLLHGNEVQTAIDWRVGLNSVTLQNFGWAVGDSVAMREAIDVTHSEIGGGSTAINKTVLSRSFGKDGVAVRHSHTLQMAADIGYFYNAMWPLLHYDAIGYKFGVTDVWSPGDGSRSPADWYGVANPFVGRTTDYVIEARGPAFTPDGAAGVPSALPAPLRFRASLQISPDSVDGYLQPGGRLFAAKAMNTSGGTYGSGGYSSGVVKLYFERNSTNTPQPYASGAVINCQALYTITLEPAA